MGAIFQRGDTWYISYRHKGRRHRESVGPSKALATQALAKRVVEITEGKFFPHKIKGGMTFAEMADKWLTEYSQHRKKSYCQDKYVVAKLKDEFPYITLEAFTSLMIEQMRTKLIAKGLHPLTVNRYHQTTKAIFNKAKEWGLMAGDNPAKRVKLASERKYWRTRYLSKEELERLLAAIEDPQHSRLRPIILTALYTGMRKGEIEGIRKQDINLERREIFLPDTKNDEPAYIPIPEALAGVLDPILARLEGSQDRVFNYARFVPRWRRLLQQVKIEDFRFHDLRHTFASYITMATGDLAATQRLLRHKIPTMTQRYTHHAPKFLRGIVNQLDIGFGPKLAPQPQPAPLPTTPIFDGQVALASASATP